MAQIFGFNFPTVDVTGLLSQSWIYILIISLITIFALVAVCVLLFFMTYNKKVEVFENIGGGSKMVRTIRTRARLVKVGSGGEELLFLLRPRVYRTAYGKKIASNTYGFVVGEDGYWRNMVLGDFNLKTGILDIEPVEQDVRLAHTSIGKMIDRDYNPNKSVIVGMSIFLAVMTVIWLVGAYVIIGKFGTISQDLNGVVDKFQAVADTQAQTSTIIANAKLNSDATNINVPAGLAPAPTGSGG